MPYTNYGMFLPVTLLALGVPLALFAFAALPALQLHLLLDEWHPQPFVEFILVFASFSVLSLGLLLLTWLLDLLSLQRIFSVHPMNQLASLHSDLRSLV